MKILTKYDRGIIVSVLILTIFVYIFIGVGISNHTPDSVEIKVDGKLYANYKLSEVQSQKVINISTSFGENTLKITNDGAEMIYSNCKDRLDVKCGKITKSGQMIICIPNRITVELLGNRDKVDKVTY